MKIGLSKFAEERHRPGTGKTFFKLAASDPDWKQALNKLIEDNWDQRRAGVGRDRLTDVVCVPIDPSHFQGNTVTVQEGMRLVAKLDRRRPEEDPFISVQALRSPQGPVPAIDDGTIPAVPDECKFAYIVLYHDAILTAEERAGCEDAEWVIVAMVASAVENEPMHPVAMARNFLHRQGGTFAPYSAEEFAQSILYWQNRCGVAVEKPVG